jgi:hypothetical protein
MDAEALTPGGVFAEPLPLDRLASPIAAHLCCKLLFWER